MDQFLEASYTLIFKNCHLRTIYCLDPSLLAYGRTWP
ncbi:hypothetical protein GLYMA_16G124350v4 [Glycine max]|nr:hypothetical protein GLYMA_16G124350v4 [Glycine max]KAH1151189.1 hypothetical protein GYH30_044922 [Glycine max]